VEGFHHKFVVEPAKSPEKRPEIIVHKYLLTTDDHLIPSFLLEVSLAILIESGINFIGMRDPDMASWGKLYQWLTGRYTLEHGGVPYFLD
jgi:ABC-type dipeptide/oligopeptide/nickel transport system permease subunit